MNLSLGCILTAADAMCVHLFTSNYWSASAGLGDLQVYAYTTSELQVAILRLFVRAECRLPNLFVGTLTRESVTQALEFGVQADQIVSFLQQHAHPHVLHKVPIVPEVCAALCYLHNPHHSLCLVPSDLMATASSGHALFAHESSICTYCCGAGSGSCPC